MRIISMPPQDGVLTFYEETGLVSALIPPGHFSSAHAPALFETKSGHLLCAWFAGSWEGQADISIVVSRLKQGEEVWEEPIQVSRDAERSEQNPSFFACPDGSIWLIYTAQKAPRPDKASMQYTAIIRKQVSWDEGETWSEPETLFDEEGSFCRQPIQILSNGRWIFENWMCEDSKVALSEDKTVFRISDDAGKNWRTIPLPKGKGRVHANLLEREPGHLIAFFRSRSADYIYRSDSYDYGDTWTDPNSTCIPNNNASLSVIQNQEGKFILACNPTNVPGADPDKTLWPGLRCPIAVAASEDEGKNWPYIRLMEMGFGFVGSDNLNRNPQFEYPWIMQSRNGLYHLVYAWRNRRGICYQCFTEEDLLGTERRAECRWPMC